MCRVFDIFTQKLQNQLLRQVITLFVGRGFIAKIKHVRYGKRTFSLNNPAQRIITVYGIVIHIIESLPNASG